MTSNTKIWDTVVVGAGQAGLAAGYRLARNGLNFLILDEQALPGGNWRNYYDSLRLFSPAGYSSLPGTAFPGDAGHYPLRDEVVQYLEGYAAEHGLPVRQNTRVTRVERHGGLFVLHTAEGVQFHCRALVVASGAFSQPHIPPVPGLAGFAGAVVHSAQYRNPEPFAGQRVVVVGAANSAVQIAHELAAHATVTLATKAPVRFFPQRVLGIDFHSWLRWTGLARTRWLRDQGTPVLDSGKYRQALQAGLYRQTGMFQRMSERGVVWQDGSHEVVDSVIFATGFRPNLSFMAGLEVIDASGHVMQKQGRAIRVPGLYFVGLPRQRNFASATLRGVGPDADHLLPHIQAHLRSLRQADTAAGAVVATRSRLRLRCCP